MSATTNLGKVSVTPKGAWASTNTYEILDIVTSGGSSYLAKQDVPTGVPLSNTSYWIMIAEKGDGGEVTSASASISGGYGTPGVSVTAGGTPHERTLAFAFTNLRGEKGETGNGIDSVYKTGTSGLVDTYTILFTDGSTYEFEVNNGTASIDDTLTKSGWAADAKVVGDTKASIDGFYETMGVGVADNLTPYSEDSGATQDIPFIAQGTGGGNGESVVDAGSYFRFKRKLGNTVCVNQLAKTDGTGWNADSGGTFTFDSGSNTVNASYAQGDSRVWYSHETNKDHYYLITGTATSSVSGLLTIELSRGWIKEFVPVTANTPKYFSVILHPTSNTDGHNRCPAFFVDTEIPYTLAITELKIHELTVWFGSNDRIPSDLLSHPENWGRYYAGSLAYNAGTLESADGTVLKSIGRQIWDEEWELGNINSSGVKYADNSLIRSKNYIEVIPNETYYCYIGVNTSGVYAYFYDSNKSFISGAVNVANNTFTIPANARYMLFKLHSNYGTTYNHDITISLYYPGESGYDQYYPYSVLAEVDTGSEPLYGDGTPEHSDSKAPDGTITRKRITYTITGNETVIGWYDNTSAVYAHHYGGAIQIPNLGIAYGADTYGIASNGYLIEYANNNKAIYASLPTRLDILDDSYTTQAAWLAGITGTVLIFDVVTPTTEQGTAFPENIPCDDFGSMYWTQTKGIPQGNEIFYPVDYKASIDTLYNRVEGDMSAIVIDSQLEVVADRIPEAPSEDGTYTLKATVSSGTKTYSWVADE